jgi:L-fuconate dehydratase
MNDISRIRIDSVEVEDIRFRFPRLGHGSDAINPHTDYSNPYVTVRSSEGEGVGIGFSLGRGNDMICQAVDELSDLVVGKTLQELLYNFGEYKWVLSNPVQSRWIAPNGGPYYMAGGAIMNALFDLWSKAQGKPLWRALVDLEPEEIASMIDFRYVDHLLTRSEALALLDVDDVQKNQRIDALSANGLPAYFTTWIGTGTNELVEQIQSVKNERGFSGFKLKVGSELAVDVERLEEIRRKLGHSIDLYTDANQVWSTEEAINWMHALADYDIKWIEEPTAPDSVSAHRLIREGIAPDGIHVVTGENCPNPQIAAEFIAGGAVDRFQIDACRMMGPSDVLLVMLVARKYGVPICPHAGGSGLDELVPHLAAWNYVRCSADMTDVVVEQVGFCSHFFSQPSIVENGRIRMPEKPGYLVGMRDEARSTYRYPSGSAWNE